MNHNSADWLKRKDAESCDPAQMSPLDSVRWIDFSPNHDPRGTLTAIEGSQTIPFEIKRVFYLTDVVADRAGHAHRDTHELIVGLAGSFTVEVSDGLRNRSFEITAAHRGLYLPPMIFIRLRNFSPGTVMLALTSTHYDCAKSIRSWEEFLAALDEVGQ